MHTALITGGSAGLGRALTAALATRGWRVVVDARHADELRRVVAEIGRSCGSPHVVAVPGDVTDVAHRAELAAVVGASGLDLLVHNASTLGPRGLRSLAELGAADLRDVLAVNVVAPVALTAAVLPALRRAGGIIVTVSSDAAVEHYETWGGYGASKAALDHVAGTLAAEVPEVAAYAVDPGDMRTAMHQAAFPGEDISDRPLPETVLPALLRLLDERPPSGRYRLADLAGPRDSAERGSAVEVPA